ISPFRAARDLDIALVEERLQFPSVQRAFELVQHTVDQHPRRRIADDKGVAEHEIDLGISVLDSGEITRSRVAPAEMEKHSRGFRSNLQALPCWIAFLIGFEHVLLLHQLDSLGQLTLDSGADL